ncbi:MAG: ArsI/CadI family heavy metal resistance metalloenzyme [Nannocystales bacterium]
MTLTQPRVHVAVAVSDLDRSIAFYERMFGLEAVKKRPGYAKFELSEPGLNFTLNETAQARPPGGVAHYGIEVPATSDVEAFARRVQSAGLESRPEDNVTCCHAVMDRIWMQDPDGHAWEVFAVTQSDVDSAPAAPPKVKVEVEVASDPEQEKTCCEPTCCT